SAVLHYTEQFDKVKLKPADIRVPAAELQAAHAAADPDFLDTIRNIRQNVLSFQMGLLHTDAILSVSGSHELQLRYRPLKRVGICVPGGAASYPSTLLMTVCPAQAAGVRELAVVMPPTPNGAFILVRDINEAATLTNQLAPEHLHIQTRDPEAFADRIESAGAMFLGHFTPVALGDYAAGPSHVLPTGGTARFTSGLTANDFLRCSSVLSFTLRGMKHLAEDVVRLAEKEGLTGHAHSVSIRMSETKLPARPPKKAVKSS